MIEAATPTAAPEPSLFPSEPPSLLTTDDLCRRHNIARRTLQVRVKEGRFPAPDRVEGRTRLWSEETVENWEKSALDSAKRAASYLP